MSNGVKSDFIMVSKETVYKKGGIVILDLKKYQKLCEQAVPVYHLIGKEAKELDKLVKEGVSDHRSGRTKKIRSLADLD